MSRKKKLSERATRHAASASSKCQRVGPFANREAAADAQRRLAETGLPTRLTRVERPRVIGQRVFVPPLAGGATADRLARRLRRGGIHGLLVYHSGELKNGISLGVFADPQNADRLAEKAHELGVATRRALLRRPVESHFVELERPPNSTAAHKHLLDSLALGEQSVQAIACPATARHERLEDPIAAQ